MTTDTVPKAFSKKVRLSNGEIHVTGIAKGAGMIRPDMATMLGFVATDARCSQEGSAGACSSGSPTAPSTASASTATLRPTTPSSSLATGKGAAPSPRSATPSSSKPRSPTSRADLAQAIVRDGEGATKFVTVRVERGRSARRMPQGGLRHRAFAAGEDRVLRLRPQPRPHPRRGRLFRRRGEDREGGPLPRRGAGGKGGGRHPAYREEQGVAAMKKPEFTVRVVLNRGKAEATVWTCDLLLRLRENQRRVPDVSKELEKILQNAWSNCSRRRRRRPNWKASIAFRWRSARPPWSPGLAATRAPRASHQAFRPARHRQADRARRAEHAPVHRRQAGQQRAPHRGARHRQVLDREGAAEQVFEAGLAPDRGGEERPRRPAHDRRPGRGARRSASCCSATT